MQERIWRRVRYGRRPTAGSRHSRKSGTPCSEQPAPGHPKSSSDFVTLLSTFVLVMAAKVSQDQSQGPNSQLCGSMAVLARSSMFSIRAGGGDDPFNVCAPHGDSRSVRMEICMWLAMATARYAATMEQQACSSTFSRWLARRSPSADVCSTPIDVTFGPDGNLYVSRAACGVQRFDGLSGAFIDVFVALKRWSQLSRFGVRPGWQSLCRPRGPSAPVQRCDRRLH